MLIERFMGLNDDGSTPVNGYTLKIPIQLFYAACIQIMNNGLSVAQVKALVWLPFVPGALPMRTVPVNDQTEFDALIALAPSAGNVAGRSMYLQNVIGILHLAERRIAGYDTPALVRAKLGI
jgi:hypothetical protein